MGASLETSRDELRNLADEQTALRHVATLVARGAPSAELFDAVTDEVGGLLGVETTLLMRFEPDGTATFLAGSGWSSEEMQPGVRRELPPWSVSAGVMRTGESARINDYDPFSGDYADILQSEGIHAAVASPIAVEGRTWGTLTIASRHGPLPEFAEERLVAFSELVATAIANAEARAELMASRARLVAASDEARRRVERDLHDGLQQRLVLLALELRSAETMAPSANGELAEQLTHMGKGLAEALDNLRELSRGIHPAILSEGGLVPALKALARRSAVPVRLDLPITERFAEHVEIGAYYVVSEALTNVAKHASASKVEVHARALDGVLELNIDDDGVGGANPGGGSGLTGLADRVDALGGAISITSPRGQGTSLHVELPLPP
jgi:signal transduction histidine kinase